LGRSTSHSLVCVTYLNLLHSNFNFYQSIIIQHTLTLASSFSTTPFFRIHQQWRWKVFFSVWVILFSTFLLSSTKISWKSTFTFLHLSWIIKDEMNQISSFLFSIWFTGLISSWTMPFSLKISTNLCKIFCFMHFFSLSFQIQI
jgi:hypothetical protein